MSSRGGQPPATEDGKCVEESKEFIENPDGSYTVKTTKIITTMIEEEVEEDEEEEVEEEGENEEENEVEENGVKENGAADGEVEIGNDAEDDDKFGADGLGQLTKEEREEFMLLQAERKWLDNMAAEGGAEEEEEEEQEEQPKIVVDTTVTKKKKKRPDGEKRGKGKKKKRGDGKENKRDDILAKHVGPRVRSFDSAKMKSRFENKPKDPMQVSSECRACSKQVFQMEKIVAEKAAWHKNCFRCSECSKTLTLETYQSHEGILYCKPHFKELFRPKAVVEDPAEARKERSTSKPDYGLDELTSLNVKQRFSMFEAADDASEDSRPEPLPVKRSQSMISRAARFLQQNGSTDYGVDNAELGEYDEEEGDDSEGEEGEDDEEEEYEEEEGVDEDGEPIMVKKFRKKTKTRTSTLSNAGDLKEMREKQSRRDEMTRMRKEELGRFRQMLCAGKNISLKEMFESGQFENEDKDKSSAKEEIKIDEKRAAKSLKARFEQGQPFTLDEDGETTNKHHGEIEEVEEVFREAETASHARNLFKAIDSKANEDGSAVLMRSQSFANRDNRKSMDGLATEDVELGRDPNLIKCTDNYQDDVDCRNTRSILNMFKKMEAKNTTGEEEDDASPTTEEGPRPLHRFTPPPEGESEYDDSEEEYSGEDEEGEDYSDEEEEGEEGEEFSDEEGGRKAPYKDELLQMLSAKKAANLRAKFEKWETEVERQNGLNKGSLDDDEEAMPSLDTAKNLKAMFEEKAQDAAKPLVRERAKVNRFV